MSTKKIKQLLYNITDELVVLAALVTKCDDFTEGEYTGIYEALAVVEEVGDRYTKEGEKMRKSKVHCILCDRKDDLMFYTRLPRNCITVPVCPKCVERYELFKKDINSLGDILMPVFKEAIDEEIKEEGH